ncbi:MAG: carboxy terminal-processing peptidase [Armatimonadetes bacterium]|nr:carboxy terminal-processing peptidase [Armatimonadota bacterium]
MQSIHHSSILSRQLARTAALFAGTLSVAALLTGTACTRANQNANITGDALVTGATMEVAANAQVGGRGAQTNGQGVRSGTVSLADDAKIAQVATQLLSQAHYARVPVNDSLSPKVFDAFVKALDPQRTYLLASDVDALAKQYRTTIVGRTVNKGDFAAAQQMYALLLKRAGEQTQYATEALKKPSLFTFTGNDEYTVDRETADRPTTAAASQELWKQRLRYEYLQEKLSGEKPDAIVKTLTRRYERSLRSLKELDSDDIFELYMNSIAHSLDPHTDYFGKATAETFAISMKLSLFGIGATLRSEDGYTVIEEIRPGSPAQKTDKLKAGDKITGVAQGKNGAFVDVVDMKLNRVVDQIRGDKDSVVRLRYIPGDATDPSKREEVSIVRDEIKLDDQQAKARLEIVPQATGKPLRVGVIDLPLFYQDSDKGKSCSADVALLIQKLQAEKVDGVVLDLRNNGGGSLQEAIKLTGLFIESGPVVQVKDSKGDIRVSDDEDRSVSYAGPMVVLTSRTSASASEIVAGALQDYGRAVVVGDSSSFGKGTVQAVYDLGPVMSQSGASVADDPGQVKLTIQKFYRASGASTQLRGVVPDIILPSLFDALEVGEGDLENPLPYDTIESAEYRKIGAVAPVAPALVQKSAARIAGEPDFAYLKQTIARVAKAQNTKTISLNEAKRRKEQTEEEARAASRQKTLAARAASKSVVYPITLEDAAKPGLPKPLTVEQIRKGLLDGAKEDDTQSLTEINAQKKGKVTLPEPDIALAEAQRILGDYVSLGAVKLTAAVTKP